MSQGRAWMVALAAALLPAAARASGGAFDGATQPNGSAIYYDPAALAAGPAGSALLVDLTGAMLGLSYQREPEDPAHEPAYRKVGFTTGSPDLAFLGGVPLPWPSLRFIAGGFSPAAGMTKWPEDGPQRYHGTSASSVAYAIAAGLLYTPSANYGFAALVGPTYLRIHLRYAIDFAVMANGFLPPGAQPFALETPELQGWATSDSSGWTVIGVLGAWARPTPSLRLGAGLTMPRQATANGDVAIEMPPLLGQVAPDYHLAPGGKVRVHYPMAWTATFGADLTLSDVTVGAQLQYLGKSHARLVISDVFEADPKFIEGTQVTMKGTHDTVGGSVRASMPFTGDLDAGLRFTLTPRATPKQAITPTNPDFTILESCAGVRWRRSTTQTVGLSYSYMVAVPVQVDRSIYNPRASSDSGIANSSARGRYEVWAHKLVLNFEGFWQ